MKFYLIQAVSINWSVIINPQRDRSHMEGVQRRDLVRIDGKLSK